MPLEQTVLQIIRGERRAPFIKPLLTILSCGYRFGVALRNWAYDRGLCPSVKLNKCVVSVGNIAVGGTGKTPCVQWLAQELSSSISVAILTRGFRSQREHEQPNGPLPVDASAQDYGDEPLWLARKTGVPIWVGKNRVASGKLAIKAGAECVILDDGMQHRRLHRDIEIVVVDGKDPLCERRFLPAGLLRDSPGRLNQATAIVVTHVQSRAHYERVKTILSRYSLAPLIGAQIRPLQALPSGQKVGVFCGIGKPERFLQTVRDLNQEIVDTLICNDHGFPSEEELHSFAKKIAAKGGVALLCTEKDAIKLPKGFSLDLPIFPVEIELKIVEGEDHWRRLIETIVKKVKA